MAKRKRKPPKKKDFLDVVTRAKEQGIDAVNVALSLGRDSVATLDLCSKHFSRIECFHMYDIKGLSFVDRYIEYLEQRYGVKVIQVPSWNLSLYFKTGFMRHPSKKAVNCRRVTVKDIWRHIRKQTGVPWIATGERQTDSIERMAQIKSVNGINDKREVVWPLAVWSKSEVHDYLTREKIPSSPEYEIGLRSNDSFGRLWGCDMIVIRDKFPEDYQKIKKRFPLIDAEILNYERNERIRRQKAEKEAQGSS